jgi:subtilase family serine protease
MRFSSQGKLARIVAAASVATMAVASRPAWADAIPTLLGSVPAQVTQKALTYVAAPAPGRHLKLAIAMPIRDASGLDTLLARIYDPAGPDFRRYISVAAFAKRFAPSEADYQTAVSFFRSNGMTVQRVSANRLMIDVDTSVADAERVFHVKMGLYQHPTEHRLTIAPDREPTLDLAVPVSEIIGLDDLVLPMPRVAKSTLADGDAPTGSGPHGYFIGSDVRTAYYGQVALTGFGQSLGLMELAGYNLPDIQAYFAKLGQPLDAKVVGISTDGSPLDCPKGCNDVEQALDIEYAISMAPGLKQVQVYVANSPESVMAAMASDNTSLQLSTSWGWRKHLVTDEALMKEMAVQGQSYLTASGDYSSLQASGPWPEEDPYITAVGGTDLVTAGPGGAWQAETGWSGSAGGPSLDARNTIPSYQVPFINQANKGSVTLRNVPDIAGDANTDNYICGQGHCDGGWGGTSFASPIWAGFIALVNQQAAAEGKPPVGFLNPALYGIGAAIAAHAYHDELHGKSGLYHSTRGYDLVTGLGSPRGQSFINALASGKYAP